LTLCPRSDKSSPHDDAVFSVDALSAHGGPLSPATLTQIQSHPRISDALFEVASRHLAGLRKNPLVVTDLGRLVIVNLALYLHFSYDPALPRSGLGVSRMRTLCVQQGVCSSGCALAAVAVMRRAGLLEVAPNSADRRLRLLVPTERLINVCTQHWETVLRAAALVISHKMYDIGALRRTDVLRAFMRNFGRHFCSGVRMFPRDADLTRFAYRDAGLTLMFALLLARGQTCASNEAVPITISVTELARQCAVSRPQVLRLLDDAAKGGLIERLGADRLTFAVLPELPQSIQRLFARIFSLSDYYMRAAMDAVNASGLQRWSDCL
jgi:DNA-binding MarR family transcriptional regulator